MTYHARHIGRVEDLARLTREGWTVLGSYPPISPVIDVAVWLRCPETCCAAGRCPDCGALLLACRCGGGE